ncbi:MAG TPA: carbohydrate kinase family protein [Methylomirabilota bacterium]|nr:carbohydrate kinase family protein [Methylomirabilota bacterium]
MGSGGGPAVLVVGYLSLDEISVGGRTVPDVAGGAALYAALGAARAGAAVGLVATCGDDFPEAALAGLRDAGIDLGHLRRAGHPSRRARIAYRPDGSRVSSHWGETAWHAATRALAPPPWPASARPTVVVLTAMPLELLGRHLDTARQAGARAVVDTSEVFAARERDRLLALLDRVDLFAPSREETRWLCPGLDDDAALRVLAGRCARVVQKRGAEGLILVSPVHPAGLRIPASPIPGEDPDAVPEPTGAGDACVGALGAGLARGLDDAALLALASAIAARAVSGLGPAGLGLATPLSATAGP